ncbi:hypothetical protein JOF29_002617 [Kribbella aluminosa]|uniref:Uncharacterized protein n=1 Tax=Kribbella aluminosa TaxID=416017 RepID=A0ABS4UJ21_9ACTN|nr:hypothetical protein [Kribbella aluminosa]MBP2351534.1 hypothetical protein [Kribbella aluminosa]
MDTDEIFLALAGPFEEAAERVARVLGLEPNGDLRVETGELQYKGRARSSDGVVGVYIGPNTFEPEPDEAQAMDGYGVVVDVQYRTHKPQAEEARLAFEALVEGLPDVPVSGNSVGPGTVRGVWGQVIACSRAPGVVHTAGGWPARPPARDVGEWFHEV